MALPEAAFRRQLGAFSRGDLASFLVDLWTARGREATRCGKRIRLRESPSSSATWVYPVPSGQSQVPVEDVDVVVTATDLASREIPNGVEVVDPATLYRLVRYALAGTESERLLATHFDVASPETDLASVEPAASSDRSSLRAGETTSRESPGGPTGDPSGAGSDHAPGVPDAGSVSTARSQSVTCPHVDPRAGGQTAERAGESPRSDDSTGGSNGDDADRRSDGPSRRTVLAVGGALLAGLGTLGAVHLTGRSKAAVAAPGVDADGVSDAATLAEAHAAFVEGVSYTLGLHRVGYWPDRRLRSYLSMDLSLALDRSYLTRVATAGPEAPKFLGEPPARRVYWSDGSEYLARTPGSDEPFHRFEPTGSAGTWEYWAWMIPFGGTYGSSPERYYRTLFEAVPTRLAERGTRDGEPVYHLVADGQPGSRPTLDAVGASELRDVDLAAEIDRHGVVRTLSLDYRAAVDGDTVGVHRSLAYSGIENTDVERPDG